MSDFYCEEVLSGKTPVQTVAETEHTQAFRHTQPSYPTHIVVIPKRHIPSLVALEPEDDRLLLELMGLVRQVASEVLAETGACRVITNLGRYQDSKHLHFHIVSGERIK